VYPPKREYEKVPVGIEVEGVIGSVEYDMKHKFKAFNEGEPDPICPAIRFKLRLDGCQYDHPTRWMKFNMGEKSTLYKKYISEFIANSVPDMQFDLDVLKGFPIVTTWTDNGEFQNLEIIRAAGLKMAVTSPDAECEAKTITPEIDLDNPEVEVTGTFGDDHPEPTPF